MNNDEKDQNDLASWVVIGVGLVLFFLAFQMHSFVPILFIVPLALICMRKKKPEQQASTTRALYPEAKPKETPLSEYEQPMAQYPEQMPPMTH